MDSATKNSRVTLQNITVLQLKLRKQHAIGWYEQYSFMQAHTHSRNPPKKSTQIHTLHIPPHAKNQREKNIHRDGKIQVGDKVVQVRIHCNIKVDYHYYHFSFINFMNFFLFFSRLMV